MPYRPARFSPRIGLARHYSLPVTDARCYLTVKIFRVALRTQSQLALSMANPGNERPRGLSLRPLRLQESLPHPFVDTCSRSRLDQH